MPLFAIPAGDIDAAGRSIAADLPVAWLDEQLSDCDMRGAEPGHVSGRISRSGSDIVVRGRVHTVLQAPCARCLEPTKLDVEAEMSLLLKPAPPAVLAQKADEKRAAAQAKKAAGGSTKTETGKKAPKEKELPEYEFSSEEAEVDIYDGETVVLDGFIREAILLEMPIFPLCSEACPGIRPASPEADEGGAEPPIDPRLAPLGALRAALAKSGSRGPNDDQGAATGSADASQQKKTKKE
ncbi:YceD family protein [Polyangium jinanense]|uniref:DUF177 domain-containing protein n=1 Tax=Polyangium jinanense TaxID=2829994 RepID=A0A9X3XDU8_9BACT|nr:DUF177 domain-containing protein [Polyangium jinanense]MDC3957132.1 DUF177 domain-containing protein [Polyangium jinanense]MDC3986838.1 DUF177 domain-containing protein [Polyangium jinanense]